MKLFQRLLVAPAALGLIAPMAATATELNINEVSNYSETSAETQSISAFSDVYPTDWAYQALNDLRKRSGCSAATPRGSMTRYEAAALLNKCLSNISQVTEEEQSLIDEFSSELAVIQGRLDVLENNLDGVEAGVFSTTTKLSGLTTFVIGGVETNNIDDTNRTESVTFNYDTRIALDTSFTGDDLLKTVLRSGNFNANDPFGTSGISTLETAFISADDQLAVHRNYYQFPIGEDLTATLGAVVRQDDMLGVWPSAYPSESVLDSLTYAGARAAYNLSMGQGAGLTYAKDNISASLLFVSENGDRAISDNTNDGGLLTAQGSDDLTTQIAWIGDEGLTLAAAYTVSDGGNDANAALEQDFTAFGLSAVYETDFDSDLVPSSISAGMGWESPDIKDSVDEPTNSIEDKRTWTIGLLWSDAFEEGNTLGFGIGTSDANHANSGHKEDVGYDDPLAYELFYQMTISDNVTVTPAMFVQQRDGQHLDDVVGGLVKTTFNF